MVLNYIWISFFLVGLLAALVNLFIYYFTNHQAGNGEVFTAIIDSTFDMSKTSFEIALGLTGILCLWLGIMKIGEKGGAVQLLSKLVGPFFNKLFPELPEDHPARGSMLMNFSANMLGLDNAATPMGLKAMKELQETNPEPESATKAMIMFLVLNTSGLTLIPVAVMNYRSQFQSENPADVFLPILIATFFASLIGLITVAIYQKINLLNKVILAYLGGITTIIIGLIWYFSSLSPEAMQTQSKLFSNVILYGLICSFIWMAFRKKINVYEAFIEGAIDGFQIAVKIIPYLVAMLVAIGVFRASGAMDFLIGGMEYLFGLFLNQTDFVHGLPTAFMKPLSGSGARGLMLESFEHYGVDSFIGRLNATLQGATDTTFYIVAVYFGSVGIRNTKYAIKAGLLADLAGIVAAIFISYSFFGHQTTAKTNTSPEDVMAAVTTHWPNPNSISELFSENCYLYNLSLDTLAINKKELIVALQRDSAQALTSNTLGFYPCDKGFLLKTIQSDQKTNYLFQLDKNKVKSIQILNIHSPKNLPSPGAN